MNSRIEAYDLFKFAAISSAVLWVRAFSVSSLVSSGILSYSSVKTGSLTY